MNGFEICEEPPLFVRELQKDFPEWLEKFQPSKIKAYQVTNPEDDVCSMFPYEPGIAFYPVDLSLEQLINLAEKKTTKGKSNDFTIF